MEFKKALEILFDNTCIETIDKAVQTPDFWEVIGTCGGDVYRYRVYNDGSIYEK